MEKYWAHLVISNDEEWEGDVYKVEEVEAEIARLRKALEMARDKSMERHEIERKTHYLLLNEIERLAREALNKEGEL